MNPDRLFDYLDGRLSPAERAQLEERLMSDEQLRQQFNIAREIHRSGGVSREVVLPSDPERGGRLGRRIAVAAIVLVFANVIGGLAFITFKNTKSADTKRQEEAIRRQVTASIGAAAQKNMPLTTFVPAEVIVLAPRAEWETMAARLIALAGRLGGEALKAPPDEKMLMVVADVPTEREQDFRSAINALTQGLLPSELSLPMVAPAAPDKRTIVQVRIADPAR